jgi:hypothetical protein
MVAAPLDSSGSFALRDVPDGDFVVRIIGSLKGKLAQRVLVQRVVRVAAQSVDLGELRPVTGVRADWPCRDARVGGVWLRQAVPGAERGVFVATVRVHGGRIELPELEPGSYLAEPFTAPTDFRFPTVGAGRSFGVLIPLRVGAEGALDPPRLVLPPDADADADADAQRAR